MNYPSCPLSKNKMTHICIEIPEMYHVRMKPGEVSGVLVGKLLRTVTYN